MNVDLIISSLVSRLANMVSLVKASGLDQAENDVSFIQTKQSLIDLSKHKIHSIVTPLLAFLEEEFKATESMSNWLLSDVQICYLDLISCCLEEHWKHCYFKNSDHIEKTTKKSVFPKINPPPLDENLAANLNKLVFRFLYRIFSNDSSLAMLDHFYKLITNSLLKRSNYKAKEKIYPSILYILCYICASNWEIVLNTFRSRIFYLATTNDDEAELGELSFLRFVFLNQERLSLIFNEINPRFMQFKRVIQLSFTNYINRALWNWIETFPEDFVKLWKDGSNLSGGPEVLFDMCNILCDSTKKRESLWPLQTSLLLLCPKVLNEIVMSNSSKKSKKAQFIDSLRKGLDSPKLRETSIISFIDICKAASHLHSIPENALKTIYIDVDIELKDKIFNSKCVFFGEHGQLSFTNRKYMIDYLFSLLLSSDLANFKKLIKMCLNPSMPSVFKIILIKSCLLVVYQNTSYSVLDSKTVYSLLSEPIRKMFMENFISDLENYIQNFHSNHTILDKKGRKIQPSSSQIQLQSQIVEENVNEKKIIITSILEVLKYNPLLILECQNKDFEFNEVQEFIYSISKCVDDASTSIRTQSSQIILNLHDPDIIHRWGPKNSTINSYWLISSNVLSTISYKIFHTKEQEESNHNVYGMIDTIYQILIKRKDFITEYLDTKNNDEIKEGIDVIDRLFSLIITEISLLTQLCSEDPKICHITSLTVSALCEDAELTYFYEKKFNQNMTMIENSSTFKEFANSGILVTGKVAQQKNIRRLLRKVFHSTPGNIYAWEDIYKKWKRTKASIFDPLVDEKEEITESKKKNFFRTPKSNVPTPPKPAPKYKVTDEVIKWKNYTGFLCSLGGCCVLKPENEAMEEDIFAEQRESRKKKLFEMLHYKLLKNKTPFSSKKIKSQSEIEQNTSRYLMEMVELLICDNPYARESVREILGTELSPHLYSTLLHHLEGIVSRFFSNTGEVLCNDSYTMFVDQSISILKHLLNRMKENLQGFVVVDLDIGNLLLSFALYINKLEFSLSSLKTKIKMCSLLKILLNKTKHPIASFIKQELSFKNRFLSILIEWTSEYSFNSTVESTLSLQNQQKELDMVCMKVISMLLEGLHLQPFEQLSPNDNIYAIKSELFYNFFSCFNRFLNKCRIMELTSSNIYVSDTKNSDSALSSTENSKDVQTLRKFTITALSNLLSSNIEIGLKYSLAMGYDENNNTRTVFMQVLSSIFKSDLEIFLSPEKANLSALKKIIELITEPELYLFSSISEICHVKDIDRCASVFLEIFITSDLVMELLKSTIEIEIEKTESPSELFRRNSMATRLLSLYFKKHGTEYLKNVLGPVLFKMQKENLIYELDPAKATSETSIDTNINNLKNKCKEFLDPILNSVDIVPNDLKQVFSYLSKVVIMKFPSAKVTSVGSLMFLRFLCPAIVSPETHDLLNVTPDSKLKRGVLLITKVVQNLANHVSFGSKESFMVPLNDILKEYSPKVTDFLTKISSNEFIMNTGIIEPHKIEYNVKDLTYLHYYLYNNLEKIGKEILSKKSHYAYPLSRPFINSTTREEQRASAKSIYYQLSKIISQIGLPMSNPLMETQKPNTNQKAQNHDPAFTKFIKSNEISNNTLTRFRKVFYGGSVSKGKTPLFYLILRRIMDDGVSESNFDQLFSHILRTLDTSINKNFELFLDFTRFLPAENVLNTLFARMYALMPKNISESLNTMYVYNINTLIYGYLKKHNLLSSFKYAKKLVMLRNLSDLSSYISSSEIKLPRSTQVLENDIELMVSPVNYFNTWFESSVPVVVSFLMDNIQFTMLKKTAIFGTSIYFNDVFDITDITDIEFNNNTKNPQLFIKCKNKYMSTNLYISGPKTQIVYQELKEYKKNCSHPKKQGTIKSSTIINKKGYDYNQRNIKPSNVPGTLINIALLNLGCDDEELRTASYDLLYSLCSKFGFDEAKGKILSFKDAHVPKNIVGFICDISKTISQNYPNLTHEFISEFIIGYKNSTTEQKQICIKYLEPWLVNIGYVLYNYDDILSNENEDQREPTDQEIKEKCKRTNQLLKRLYELTIQEDELLPLVLSIWTTLAKIEELVDFIIESLITYSSQFTFNSSKIEKIVQIISSLCNSNDRYCQIICILRRKIIELKNSSNVTIISEHESWNDITILIRMCSAVTFNNPFIAQQFLPSVFCIISLVFPTNTPIISNCVHRLLLNSVQSLCLITNPRSSSHSSLKKMLEVLAGQRFKTIFKSKRETDNMFFSSSDSISSKKTSIIEEFKAQDNSSHIQIQYKDLVFLITSIVEIVNTGLPHKEALLIRTKWVGLISSKLFQSDPLLQPNMFITFGCLCNNTVRDRFFIKALAVLKDNMQNFTMKNVNIILSIIITMSESIHYLPKDTKTAPYVFWLAISMLQTGYEIFFEAAASLIESSLRKMYNDENFSEKSPSCVLLKHRNAYKEFDLLDEFCGISFKSNFSFAFTALLHKGLKANKQNNYSTKILFHLISELSLMHCKTPQEFHDDCFAYIIPLLPLSFKEGILENLFVSVKKYIPSINNIDYTSSNESNRNIFDHFGVPNDKILILTIATILIFMEDNDNDTEILFIYHFLAEIAHKSPQKFDVALPRLLPKLFEALNANRSLEITKAVQKIIHNVVKKNSKDTDNDIAYPLNNYNFTGLLKSPTVTEISDSVIREIDIIASTIKTFIR